MEPESITVTFDNRLDDHLAAARLYHQSTPLAKFDRFVAGLLLLFGVVEILLAGIHWWTPIWFVLAPLQWFDLLSVRPLVVRFWFKRNPKYAQPYQLDFDHSGVHFVTASIDSHLKWDTYSGILENDRVLLLVYGSNMYAVIPKRAFASDVQLERFRALLDEHLPTSA